MEGIGHAGGDDHQQVVQLKPMEFALIMMSLFLMVFIAGLDGTIVSTCLPKIAEDFGALDQLSWVVVSFMLSSTACSPLYGKFSDIFGRRATTLFAIAIFFVSSLLCAISQTMVQLIVFRGLQGVGGGGIFSMMWVIIGDIVPMEKRPAYTGVISTAFTLASVIGPLLGGVFTDTLTWRWSFWINLPFSGIAIVFVWKFLHIPREQVKHVIDYAGTLVIMGAVICLCLACTWGGAEYAWDSGTIIGLLVAGFVLIAIFVFVELKAVEPVLPMDLFKTRNFTAAAVVGFFLGVAMLSGFIYLPIYWQTVMKYTALRSGIVMLANALFLPVAAGIASVLIIKTKSFVLYAYLGMAVIVISQYLYTTIRPDITEANQIGYLIIGGLGFGFVVQVPMLAVQNSMPKDKMAVASTATQFFQNIGSVLGAAIFNSIINNVMKDNAAEITRKTIAYLLETYGFVPPEVAGGSFTDMNAIPEPMQTWVREGYGDAINQAFFACIWLSLCGFVACFIFKAVPLRNDSKKAEEKKEVEMIKVESTTMEVVDPSITSPVSTTCDSQENLPSVPESALDVDAIEHAIAGNLENKEDAIAPVAQSDLPAPEEGLTSIDEDPVVKSE